MRAGVLLLLFACATPDPIEQRAPVAERDLSCTAWQRTLPTDSCPQECVTADVQYEVAVIHTGEPPIQPGDPLRVKGTLTNLAAADLSIEGCVGRTWHVSGPHGGRNEGRDCRKSQLSLKTGESARSALYMHDTDTDPGWHRAVVEFTEPDRCCACGDWHVEAPG